VPANQSCRIGHMTVECLLDCKWRRNERWVYCCFTLAVCLACFAFAVHLRSVPTRTQLLSVRRRRRRRRCAESRRFSYYVLWL